MTQIHKEREIEEETGGGGGGGGGKEDQADESLQAHIGLHLLPSSHPGTQVAGNHGISEF